MKLDISEISVSKNIRNTVECRLTELQLTELPNIQTPYFAHFVSGKESEECKTIKEIERILSYEGNEIDEWLNSDVHHPGYQILNGDEIVDKIPNEKEIEENENECSVNDPGPSHNKAFECLATAMTWLERQ